MSATPLGASEIDPASPNFLSAFQSAQVVVLGEHHDNPEHHALQARIVRDLNPGALVFEMLEPRHARAAFGILRGDAEGLESAFEWESRGWPDFDIYHPIFTAAPNAMIFGGALPPDRVRRAVSDGAADVFGGAAPIFGLDDALPDAQLAERVEGQRLAHCDAMPVEMLPGMVEAQRLRDAALASATVEALGEMRARPIERPVVVITGNGHARDDWGMPALLKRAFPDGNVQVATLGQFEGAAPEDPPYRHWVVTAPFDRGDPCEAFR